jgi:hypothetical protein
MTDTVVGSDAEAGVRRRTRAAPGRDAAAQTGAIMIDMAQLAGVSKQTVSRVFNDSPKVRRETRERVLSAAAQLGYRPNPSARALATGRTRTGG